MYKGKFVFVVKEIKFIRKLAIDTIRAKVKEHHLFSGTVAVMKKEGPKGFSLWLLDRDGNGTGDISGQVLELSGTTSSILVQEYLVIQTSKILKAGRMPLTVRKLHVSGIGSLNIHRDTAYFKTIIPISSRFDWYTIFDNHTVSIDDGRSLRGLVKIILDEITFSVFGVKVEDKEYLVVDADRELSLNSFDDYCWSVLIGLGLVNGHLWQQNQYFFSYSKPEMEEFLSWSYSERRDSIKSIYPIVTTNPHAWIDDSSIAEKYEGKIKPVSTEHISGLCKWIHEKDMHKSIALLIIESKKASLLMMPAGFAIAIEGLATLFEIYQPEKVKPIVDKHKSKKFINQLQDVLKEYEDDKDFQGRTILEINIAGINKPTNRERLIIPFRILGINLSEADVKALDYRNDLLHGNVNLEFFAKKKFEMDLTELAMRLMTLANAIVMKNIGYDGMIVNHAKIHEASTGGYIDEEYFRVI